MNRSLITLNETKTMKKSHDKTLIILCNPRNDSVCHQFAAIAVEVLTSTNKTVILHDLYQENFNPILTASEIQSKFSFDPLVQQHSQDLMNATNILFIHPEWWGGPPAMLKGWLDRILTPGVAYEFEPTETGSTTHIPLLSETSIGVLCTTDAPQGHGPTLVEEVWRKSVWSFCGINEIFFAMHFDTRKTGVSQRNAWAHQALSHFFDQS